ncbi:MAG: polyprenyl synthetase family protein [Opitutaceae bacterium]|nr:polyprenyl synthetase family protein [Opitutaceae bacterium]
MPVPTSPRAPADPLAIFGLLKPHFRALDQFLHGQLEQFEPEIRDMVAYCVDTSGKRLRPALVFFSGWQGEDVVPEPLVKLAAVIEMVHLATLVHDDIMDQADLRRGKPAASRAFGPDTAVLLGDALLAQALHIAAGFPTTAVCRYVSLSTRQVCTGEIMQTLARPDTPRDLRYYRRVIELKTAELFHVSCRLGAHLGESGPEFEAAAGTYGRHLGTGYQIYDDLTDFFGDEAKIGKTLGTDLASGKSTLPLLTLLERLGPADAQQLRREMSEGDTRQIGHRVAQMREFGVFEAVQDAIRSEIDSALRAIAPWSTTPTGRLLGQLADLLTHQATSLRKG